MAQDEQDDTGLYTVVVNAEEQYSIWPAGRELPLGWKDAGKTGPKADCLAHIEAVWTDMRPLSLRRQMEELARNPPPAPAADDGGAEEDGALVRHLSTGSHPIEVGLRPEKTAAALRDGINRGYVHIRFPETQGGTELGVRLDRDACDLNHADFANGTGTARLSGTLTLDFVAVRCVAEVDLPTLAGRGHLEIVQA